MAVAEGAEATALDPHPTPTLRRLSLDDHVAARVRRHAQASRPREACGVLLGPAADHAARAVRLPNRAADPERGFSLDPVHLARVASRARRVGLEIIGVWHTHPRGTARPSRADRRGAPDGWWQLVCGSEAAGLRLEAWRPGDPRTG